MDRFYRLLLGLCVVVLSYAGVAQASKPESKWRKAGKAAHAHVQAKSLKARNIYCASACRKAGARKAADAGACKESCVFG